MRLNLLTNDNLVTRDYANADMRYCVFDFSNQADPDFMFQPVKTPQGDAIDTHNKSAIYTVEIGGVTTRIPESFAVLCVEPETSDIQVLPVANCHDYVALVYNPITGYSLSRALIKLRSKSEPEDTATPRKKRAQMLAIPVTDEPNPPCIFITNTTISQFDKLNISHIG